MRPLRAAATALVAVLALSSCEGGSDPADPSPTAQPSASSSEPSTTPPTEKPTEPVLPAAATKATEAGARAFITYYWDLINYAQVTGDVKTLGSLSAATCDTCSGIASDLRTHYESGGTITGGRNTPRITEVAELNSKSGSGFGFRVEQDVSHEPQTIVTSDGAKEEVDAGTDHFTSFLLWVDGDRWRLDVLEIK